MDRNWMAPYVYVFFVACLTFGLMACGGGGGDSGGGGDNGSQPMISDLSISSTGFYVNTGGGTAPVGGTLSFTDPGGDLARSPLKF